MKRKLIQSFALLIATFLLHGTINAADVIASKPLKVFILVGQSNMQGQALLKTRPHLAESPETKALHDKLFEADGTPRVFDSVRVAAFSGPKGEVVMKQGPLTVGFGGGLSDDDKCGPELGAGVTLYEELKEPILLVKTSWGGKSLSTDFRPPSAGPRNLDLPHLAHYTEERKADVHKATGHYYRLMIEHVKTVLADPGRYHPAYDKNAGYEIAGMVWFQGWNDLVDSHAYPERGKPGSYDAYTEVMADYIRDVRKDLNAPKMPFVIGVLGVNGDPKNISDQYRNIYVEFRKAQAATADLPEFKDNVKAVLTEKYWPEEVGALEKKLADCKKQANDELKQHQKDEPDNAEYKGGTGGRWAKARREELIKEKLTPEDVRLSEIGMSNGGFHYMGSLKCYSQIGEAFAKAVVELKGK